MKRINLRSVSELLSDKEMKLAIGGGGNENDSLDGTCTAVCRTGDTVTVNCDGHCEAIDGVGVTCFSSGVVYICSL